jgi:hypothetical protein
MVLCEWPLGNGLAEAEELAALARYPDGGRVASAFGRPRFAISVTWSPTAMSRMSCRRPSSLLPRTGGRRLLHHTTAISSNSARNPGSKCPRRRRSGARRTRRSRHDATKHGARHRETSSDLRMNAPDQVAVAGRLSSGAVVAFHFRGNSRGVNFRSAINGTEGDLIVSGPTWLLVSSPVEIRGGHGGDGELSVLEVPSYRRRRLRQSPAHRAGRRPRWHRRGCRDRRAERRAAVRTGGMALGRPGHTAGRPDHARCRGGRTRTGSANPYRHGSGPMVISSAERRPYGRGMSEPSQPSRCSVR